MSEEGVPEEGESGLYVFALARCGLTLDELLPRSLEDFAAVESNPDVARVKYNAFCKAREKKLRIFERQLERCAAECSSGGEGPPQGTTRLQMVRARMLKALAGKRNYFREMVKAHNRRVEVEAHRADKHRAWYEESVDRQERATEKRRQLIEHIKAREEFDDIRREKFSEFFAAKQISKERKLREKEAHAELVRKRRFEQMVDKSRRIGQTTEAHQIDYEILTEIEKRKRHQRAAELEVAELRHLEAAIRVAEEQDRVRQEKSYQRELLRSHAVQKGHAITEIRRERVLDSIMKKNEKIEEFSVIKQSVSPPIKPRLHRNAVRHAAVKRWEQRREGAVARVAESETKIAQSRDRVAQERELHCAQLHCSNEEKLRAAERARRAAERAAEELRLKQQAELEKEKVIEQEIVKCQKILKGSADKASLESKYLGWKTGGLALPPKIPLRGEAAERLDEIHDVLVLNNSPTGVDMFHTLDFHPSPRISRKDTKHDGSAA